MRTYVPTPTTVERRWHVIDAGERVLGRVATIAATWEAGLAWLAVLVAANTALSLAYYLRWLATCLAPAGQDEGQDEDSTTRRLPAGLAMTCAAGAVALGLVAGPVLALG